MADRGSYRTKNHELLISLLRSHSESCFSVDEIRLLMQAKGSAPDRTTVYRQLEKLAARGEVVKQGSESGEGMLYRYLAHDCDSHLHLRCLDCGRIIHLDCDEATGFSEHLKASHSFTVDRGLTVICGHCGCLEREPGRAGGCPRCSEAAAQTNEEKDKLPEENK